MLRSELAEKGSPAQPIFFSEDDPIFHAFIRNIMTNLKHMPAVVGSLVKDSSK